MTSFLKQKSTLLQTRPFIVGTLCSNQKTISQTLQHISRSYFDVLELRLDSYFDPTKDLDGSITDARQLLKKISSQLKKPILLTFRAEDESGKKKISKAPISDTIRLKVITALLDLVDLIDVEIRHLTFAKEMTRRAQNKRVNVIHSYHEFEKGRLNFASLKKWINASFQTKGDFFKVAMAPSTYQELDQFFQESGMIPHKQKILIGMGEVGQVSRLIGFSFGSVFTYGHFGTEAAPGQIHVDDLNKFITSYFGLRVRN